MPERERFRISVQRECRAMKRISGAGLYRIAIFLTVAVLISAAVQVVLMWSPLPPPPVEEFPEPPEPPKPMTWEDFIREMAARIVDKIEPLASLVGIIGILFTMVFGWRKDRREMEESKLRIRQLERQLSESRDRKPPS